MINILKKNMKAIFISFIIVLSLYFVISVVQGMFVDEFDLQLVENYTYSDFEQLPGISVRSENPIYVDSDYKNINYDVVNGARVAKGSVIAKYNTSTISEEDKATIDKLDRKIDQLSQSTENTVVYDVMTIDSKIKENINLLLTNIDKGKVRDIADNSEDIHILFNKKDIKVAGADYYTAKLKEYASMKDSVLKNNSTKEKNVVSPAAGYFYSGYDGYEYLKDTDYTEITIDKLDGLMASEPQAIDPKYIGKLQANPEWHYYAYVSENTSRNLYVGQAVTLEFEFKHLGSKQISFYIDYISAVSNGKVAVNFRCETLNDNMFTLRKETAKLILTSYSGLKIDNDSLRMNEEGEQGVYVLTAQLVVFKPVSVIYSSEDFSIVSPVNKSGVKPLQIQDEVIIGGKDLYDGKIVRP